ncbi:unnamed protein product, partial [Tetraodon nigroviridis]
MRRMAEQIQPASEQSPSSWILSWLPSWCPTSPSQLKDAEEKMLKCVKRPFSRQHVRISRDNYLWTLAFSTHPQPGPPPGPPGPEQTLPGFSCMVLGAGLPSGPKTWTLSPAAAPSTPWTSWASAGAADPSSGVTRRGRRSSLWKPWRSGGRRWDWSKWCCWGTTWGGTWQLPTHSDTHTGPMLVQTIRSDFKQKYSSVFEDNTVSDYIYHLNAQAPSGETAFRNMTIPYGWARRPMLERIGQIRPDVPVSFIYGSRSSIDSDSGFAFKKTRPDVEIRVIRGAGHYVFADQPEDFNQTVLQML